MRNIVSFTVLAVMLCALPAAAQNNWDWSSIGSAGVPDNTTTAGYTTTGAAISIPADYVSDLQFRYPVTNTVGSASDITPPWTTLQMAYIDNTAVAGSIVATLYKVEKCTSTQTELCSITSSDGGSGIQCSTCEFAGGFDFANNAYYIDVTMTKTDVTGQLISLYELAIY